MYRTSANWYEFAWSPKASNELVPVVASANGLIVLSGYTIETHIGLEDAVIAGIRFRLIYSNKLSLFYMKLDMTGYD